AGASGAIFSLMGGHVVMQRRTGGPVPWLSVLASLAIGFIPGLGLSWIAHLGGLITGAVVTAILIRIRPATLPAHGEPVSLQGPHAGEPAGQRNADIPASPAEVLQKLQQHLRERGAGAAPALKRAVDGVDGLTLRTTTPDGRTFIVYTPSGTTSTGATGGGPAADAVVDHTSATMDGGRERSESERAVLARVRTLVTKLMHHPEPSKEVWEQVFFLPEEYVPAVTEMLHELLNDITGEQAMRLSIVLTQLWGGIDQGYGYGPANVREFIDRGFQEDLDAKTATVLEEWAEDVMAKPVPGFDGRLARELTASELNALHKDLGRRSDNHQHLFARTPLTTLLDEKMLDMLRAQMQGWSPDELRSYLAKMQPHADKLIGQAHSHAMSKIEVAEQVLITKLLELRGPNECCLTDEGAVAYLGANGVTVTAEDLRAAVGSGRIPGYRLEQVDSLTFVLPTRTTVSGTSKPDATDLEAAAPLTDRQRRMTGYLGIGALVVVALAAGLAPDQLFGAGGVAGAAHAAAVLPPTAGGQIALAAMTASAGMPPAVLPEASATKARAPPWTRFTNWLLGAVAIIAGALAIHHGIDLAPHLLAAVALSPLEPPASSLVMIRAALRGSTYISEGSGFGVAPERVMTAAHVVAGAERISVTTSNGTQLRAFVVLYDRRNDIAVLIVPGLAVKAMQFSGATPLPNAQVDALGQPGVLRFYALPASVDGPAMLRHYEGGPIVDALKLAAILYERSSGGPVVDPSSQRVIGMVSLIEDFVAYAVPHHVLVNAANDAAGLTEPIDLGAEPLGVPVLAQTPDAIPWQAPVVFRRGGAEPRQDSAGNADEGTRTLDTGRPAGLPGGTVESTGGAHKSGQRDWRDAQSTPATGWTVRASAAVTSAAQMLSRAWFYTDTWTEQHYDEAGRVSSAGLYVGRHRMAMYGFVSGALLGVAGGWIPRGPAAGLVE
ncbi:MAG: rhomboid family intramembrane serine protease, partial [Pseudonocardiales bacterium]|nr:rhomboid family intramembrane serine protease [Pseudonocardiales bacterium]